jgi:alpha-methylacyl-CoA racemase
VAGPLAGVRVLELAGIGPGPYAAMVLSDMGAEVVRLDRAAQVRASPPERPPVDVLNRGRRSVGVDLKSPEGVEAVLRLVASADALIEGFRPGVTERLGLGPDACLERNPRLVYGRMTGWGQDGPYASAAGHDINYIALAGALEGIGRAGGPPTPPLNLVGDFGGGGLLLAFGIDGAANLMSMFFGFKAMGMWSPERGTNLLDTGAHFYDVYECADGLYVSIGSIEPQFYAELLKRTGLDGDPDLATQMDRSKWPVLKAKLAEVFRSRTRDEWCEEMEGTDVCFAPVLSMDEAPSHPHNVARGTFETRDGVVQPAPAPRFSRTAPALERPPASPGQHTEEVLSDWGFGEDEIAALRSAGAVA